MTQEANDPTAISANPPGPWWSAIDFGDKKESAAALMGGFNSPADMVSALDWRKSISGGDEKAAKLFERYSTLGDVGKAYLSAQQKISSGEFSKPLPANATPEQVAEYRRANGIPEKPDGYFEKMPNGLVVGEDDKSLFDNFAAAMHSMNAPPAIMHGAVKWYYDLQNDQIKAQKAIDDAAKPALENKLRETWGADFGANANIYSSFMASAPKEVKEKLTQARDAEGNFILYSPEVVSWLVAQAREINPVGPIVPSGTEGTVQGVQAEIDKIEKVMRDNRTAYNKDEAMQERLRKLYAARTKLQQRSAA